MAINHKNIDLFFTIYEQFLKKIVATRMSVSKRILRCKEQAKIYASSETAELKKADELEGEDISYIFEKMFEIIIGFP